MSEYFANDLECHDLLTCALGSHRVAGLGRCPTGPHVGGVTSTSTLALGKSTQFELPGKFMKVSYNDSLSDKTMLHNVLPAENGI